MSSLTHIDDWQRLTTERESHGCGTPYGAAQHRLIIGTADPVFITRPQFWHRHEFPGCRWTVYFSPSDYVVAGTPGEAIQSVRERFSKIPG